MKHRATTLLTILALLGTFALPARSGAASEETTAHDVVEQVVRLRQAIGDLVARSEDTVSSPAEAPDELVGQLLELRREIDRVLAILEGQPPEVQAEVSDLLSVGTAPVPEARAAEAVCAEFTVFDTNEDGVVSGLDRYWRYFRLWRDDGDGVIEEKELSRLYDAGIREITTALGTYRTVDGDAGDVLDDGRIRFDLLGKRGGMATLTIDADRLARGGEFELQDGSGVALSGLQALTGEMAIVSVDGAAAPLSCP